MSKIRRTNKNIVKFDGTGDKIIVANSSDRSKLSFGQAGATEKPFSVSAWIFVADVSDDATAGHIAGIANTDNDENEYILARSSNSKILFYLYDVDQGGANCRLMANSAGTPIADSTWHHVVGTYDGSKSENGLKIYIDGAADAINQTNANGGNYVQMRNDETAFTIGGYDSNSGYFEDKMADVCIFDKELTATEVAEIYNSGKVKDMRRASTYNNLISWWKMGDDQDSSLAGGIKDYKGVNHGTLQADAVIREDLSLDTDLESDPRTAGIHIHQSFGRTRTPKSPLQYTQNLVGNTNYIIPSSESNELGASGWDIANESKDKGLSTENQRHMHLLLDSSTSSGGAGNNKNVRIAVLGYINAFGIWSELLKYDGDQLPAIQTSLQDGTAEYYVFDVSGVDKVLFFPTNNNADDISDWQLRVAFNTF